MLELFKYDTKSSDFKCRMFVRLLMYLLMNYLLSIWGCFIKVLFFTLYVTGLTKGSLPVGQRRVKSQVYDNLLIGGAGRKQKRISAPGLFVNFDPVDEWDEREECENGNGTETGSKSKNGRVTSRVRVLTARKKMEAPKAPHRTRGDGSKGRQSSRDDSSPLDENEEWAKVSLMHKNTN